MKTNVTAPNTTTDRFQPKVKRLYVVRELTLQGYNPFGAHVNGTMSYGIAVSVANVRQIREQRFRSSHVLHVTSVQKDEPLH